MSNIFENKGAFAATIVVAASDSLNRAAANYVCDGVADSVEINAALAALPAAGGKVLLLEGNYVTAANIVVPANATLEGQGKATIITPTGAAITNGIILNGDNITLKDMKVILAAGAGAPAGFRPNVIYATGRTRLLLENLWLVGDTTVDDDAANERQDGICFVTCTYSKIMNCQSQANRRNGILLYTTSNYNTVSGNTCTGNTQNGILLYSSSNNSFTGNTCQGNVKNGIALSTNANYNTISGNICQGNTENGITATSAYNNITGNVCQGNTQRGIYIVSSLSCAVTGNTCIGNGIGVTKYSGIYLLTSDRNVIMGNQCRGNGLHGIAVFRSSYCAVTGNGCHNQATADGINVEGDVTGNSDYNTITGNVCTLNASNGIEIVGGANANRNMLKGNDTYGNTSRGVVDAGTNTIFDQVMHSITLDLTGGATDIEAFFAKCPCILAGYSIVYSVATGAGAGVNIRVGRYQDGVALDDDYFDVSVSEINKNKGYSKHFVSADLTQTVIAAGDTITVGTAGGKADTGKVILVLEIAEMSN